MKSDKFLIAVVAAAWCIAVSIIFMPRPSLPAIRIVPARAAYYHHEFVEINAYVHKVSLYRILKSTSIPVSIVYKGKIQTGIGNRTEVMLRYDSEKGIWHGRWPCPWNAPEGSYEIDCAVQETYSSEPFSIARKPVRKIPAGLAVMTYESNDDIASSHPPLPNGGRGDWKNIFDWCEFTGVDALWFLGGQTAYFTTRLSFDFPWLEHNLPFLSTFAEEAHRRGFQFGVYVMAYLTFGKEELKPEGYEYAIDYNFRTGELYKTRSISLRDMKRKKDIIEMLLLLDDIPGIDYIGLDYIRNALGGYELVDQFVDEMDVSVPEGWDSMRFEDRMIWLAKKKIAREDKDFIDQWQWWRAHVVGSYVEEIIKEVDSRKPFWVFTLSWELGWQHGQDPVMMNAAGADIDAVMLYEADSDKYRDLLTHWRRYLKQSHANLIVGDVVDWNLHQKTFNPAGPEDYFLRNTNAVRQFYIDGPSKGIFLHDLHRMMWGRRGPYSRLEWALAGAHAVSFTKDIHNQSPFSMVLSSSGTVPLNEPFPVAVSIKKNKDFNQDITCQVFYSAGLTVRGSARWDLPTYGEKEFFKTLNMEVIYPNIKRLGRHYAAVRAEWLEGKKKKSYSTMCYFSIEGYEDLAPVDNEQELTAGQDSQGQVITHDEPRIKTKLMPGTTGTAGER